MIKRLSKRVSGLTKTSKDKPKTKPKSPAQNEETTTQQGDDGHGEEGQYHHARESVRLLKEQNEELKDRIRALEDTKSKDFWETLSEAIALGKQNLVDQVIKTQENVSFGRLVDFVVGKKDKLRAGSKEKCDEVMEDIEVDAGLVGGNLEVKVDGLAFLAVKGTYYVRIEVLGGDDDREDVEAPLVVKTKSVKSSDGRVVFKDEVLDLGNVLPTDILKFQLKNYMSRIIGEVRVRVSDLVRQSKLDPKSGFARASLWVKDPVSDIIIFDKPLVNPTQVLISVNYEKLPQESFPLPKPAVSSAKLDEGPVYDKHVLVVTRGTRGDVQPFIALARGLAEIKNYLVTIVTEDRYRPLIERYSDVARGAVQFRTSGGDTEKRITTAAAKWAMKQKSTALQMVMLGRSEREFFASEPMYHYWCRHLEPDLILYGFTTVNIAMVLSESLQIPMIGFLLQPTVIPSKQYPAIMPIETKGDPDTSHKIHGRIKLFFENNPIDFSTALNTMRAKRGLQPFSHRTNNFQIIKEQNLPVVVPISKDIFGGKPADWHESARLTDFIFLRTGAVPNLSPRYVRMIVEAKAVKEPLVVLCFSSMPVPRTRILELSIMMIEQCQRKPRVIALVGNQNSIRPDTMDEFSESIEESAKMYIKSGKLLVDSGAPFGRLFPQVDCIIAHGGLGTTAEILMAGKPCMTTGVLLLDQRYWGRRCMELGVAPPPVHVTDLHKTIVQNVDECLAPNSKYAAKAREVAALLKVDEEADGVEENVHAIVDIFTNESTKPVARHRESITMSPGKLATAMALDASDAVFDDYQVARGQVYSMAAENAKEIRTFINGLTINE